MMTSSFGGTNNAASATNTGSVVVSLLSQPPVFWNIENILSTTTTSSSMTGDGSMFWDNFDTISKTEIYQSLQNLEPSQYELNYHVIIKALKYIFVAMSKGKNDMAMEFYNVILLKLIHINNYEIRKMVYIYILHYANYNSTTRDLSLLSINTFQKGLQDIDPMIRALALRVLTSIQLLDILPIQILAISKHVHSDTSVHVRQCAMMAIAKVVTRTHHSEQRQLLLELIQSVLQQETNINVLSSAMIAFYEYCTSPTTTTTAATTTHHLLHDSLCILHSCYYKLCHLICDMDEYIQVICLDVLGRYGRTFFQQPHYHGSHGSASMIDQQRRVTRPAPPLSVTTHATTTTKTGTTPSNHHPDNPNWTTSLDSFWNGGSDNAGLNTSNAVSHPPPADHQAPTMTSTISRKATKPKTMTRRIIKKGFYSDEEDDSTDEEIEIPLPGGGGGGTLSSMTTNTAFRDEDNINNNGMQDPSHHSTPMDHHNNNNNPFAFEEEDLHEDHKLLLHSVRPLFKSRNAGVVLAVCTLQYYCGVASIPIRKQIGKSLVRIYKSNNKRSIEIQYVVLSSIRQLVQNDCPSAFTPFLQDFFILPNIDPNFTRMMKLDILTYLSIDPPSIIAVLNELRTYVQIPYNNHSSDSNMDDVCFVCASIRTVGRITEIARIVYDRHAQLLISSSQPLDGDATSSNNSTTAATIRKYRTESNTIALNSLYGLITFSKVHDNYNENSMMIVGETIQVLQRILHLLASSDNNNAATILDTNRVRDLALHRILLLLVNTLSCVIDDEAEGDEDDEANSDDDDDDNPTDRMNNSMKEKLQQHSGILPPTATASAIWLMGDYLGSSMSSSLSTTINLNGNNGAVATNNPQQYGKFVNPQQRSKLCFELLRLLIRSFNMLDPPEKEQAIHFASKMLLLYQGTTPPGNNEILSNIPPLCEHILALGRYDAIPDIRDRARFESSLIHYTVGLRYDTDGLDEASMPSKINNMTLSVTDVQRIFLSTKPASTYLPLNSNDYSIMKDATLGLSSEALEGGNFRFGTLSSLVGHKARSAYIPLPPWADKNSNSSLRAEKRGDTNNNKTVSVNGQPSNRQDFYQSSSDDDDEGDSTSSESSDSNSESSDDESEDDSDSDTDTDNQGDGPVGVVIPTQKLQHVNLLQEPNVHLPLPQQQTRPPIDIENASNESSSDNEDDDDEYDNDDDEDEDPAEELFPSALSSNPTLIPIRNNGMVTPSSSVLEDMRGLVLEPTSTQMHPSGRSDPCNDSDGTDAGGWITLVRSEHASGLLVEGRYLRDRKKIEEAQKVGLLPPGKPSIAILQIRFTNQKSSTAGGGVSVTRSIRHIRLVQQSSSQPSSTSTTIGLRKMMIVPSEIPELSEQQSVSCIVGIDFWNTSDRDGSYSAKIEVKFGSGLHNNISMDIKPTIGDMLVPYQKPCSVTEFDEQIRRMQGFSRIESHFTLNGTALDSKTEKKVRTQPQQHVSERILSRAALTMMGAKQNSPYDANDPPPVSMLSSSIRFIGILPSSLDPIYVVVSVQNDGTPSNNTTGTIMVCCDHALVANAFVQLLKRAILE